MREKDPRGGWRARMKYYFWATYRRKLLDEVQERHRDLYRGVVLDVGGRDRGRFRKPKDSVKRWIFADVSRRHGPSVVLDASCLPLKEGSVDVVNAIELFEHVERPERSLRECLRVLSPGGKLLLAAPFLYPVHADPEDYQRWTAGKWRLELESAGFRVLQEEAMGGYFAVLADMLRTLFKRSPAWPPGPLQAVLFPLISLVARLDRFRVLRDREALRGYTTGYFFAAEKRRDGEEPERPSSG